MSAPPLSALFAALEATWPPARVTEAPPFRLRDGKGGGQRVSSAQAFGPVTPADIDAAEAAMAEMGQTALFMIRPDDASLDQRLADRGYTVSDPTILYLIAPNQIARPGPLGRVFPTWPPFALQREIWADGGIGPARLAVMERAPEPKTTLLCRIKDTPAATVFAALDGGIAMLHALEVAPEARRKGIGETLVRATAEWAAGKGADWLALAVTEANQAANALYRKLGMKPAGRYHYRRAPGAGA